jgi:hypothetical protein
MAHSSSRTANSANASRRCLSPTSACYWLYVERVIGDENLQSRRSVQETTMHLHRTTQTSCASLPHPLLFDPTTGENNNGSARPCRPSALYYQDHTRRALRLRHGRGRWLRGEWSGYILRKVKKLAPYSRNEERVLTHLHD